MAKCSGSWPGRICANCSLGGRSGLRRWIPINISFRRYGLAPSAAPLDALLNWSWSNGTAAEAPTPSSRWSGSFTGDCPGPESPCLSRPRSSKQAGNSSQKETGWLVLVSPWIGIISVCPQGHLPRPTGEKSDTGGLHENGWESEKGKCRNCTHCALGSRCGFRCAGHQRFGDSIL